MAIVYLSICQELDIPLYGVDVPGHFILAYAEEIDEVLFYLNVFNRGTIFGREDIDKFLEQLGKEKNEKYYQSCDNLAIVKRLIQHLVFTYDNLGYLDKKEELEELYNLLN